MGMGFSWSIVIFLHHFDYNYTFCNVVAPYPWSHCAIAQLVIASLGLERPKSSVYLHRYTLI